MSVGDLTTGPTPELFAVDSSALGTTSYRGVGARGAGGADAVGAGGVGAMGARGTSDAGIG
jgi:hypothetical protein